ncbi:MAG: hypothetical protein NDJ89_12595 [Oligoflexia bacterium]|nr:hypothetical protein [Oligoflexia bacterium]
MFPLIAVGAALLAGVAVTQAVSSEGSKSPGRNAQKSPSETPIATGQSYIVTPVTTRPLAEQIGKFIV